MVPSTSEFAYTLPDGTKRRVVQHPLDGSCRVDQLQDNEWMYIGSRFITAEDVYHAANAAVAVRDQKAPSKRQQTLEKDLDSGVLRGVAVPSSLLVYPPFRKQLLEWVKGRSEKGGFPTRTALIRTFSKLREWGPAKATEALALSADNGWAGVFEPKSSGSQKAAPQRHANTDANAAKLREKMGR